MNQCVLTAQVLEIQPLRYTPAGLPALEMLLAHESEVVEATLPRKVELTIPAVALGDLALYLSDLPLGCSVQIEGFLAPVRKGSSRLKLHLSSVTRLAPIRSDPPVA